MRSWLAAVLVWLAAGQLASAQDAGYAPPRTPDGRPDFQGWWDTRFLTPVERPDGIKSTIVAPEQAKEVSDLLRANPPKVSDPDFDHYDLSNLAKVRGTFRSGLIVDPADGHIPFSKDGLAESGEIDRMLDTNYDGPETRDTSERCLVGLIAAPMRPIPISMPMQLVQTPDAVVFTLEDVEGVRVIPLKGDPQPDLIRTLDGHSAGRWEGDTLVVETTHFRPDSVFRTHIGRTIVLGRDSRVTERFTLASDDELVYQATITDAAFYTQSWTMEFSLIRTKDRPYEYACHEANYSLANMLKHGRVEDWRKTQKSPKNRPH